uniref:UDP-N-acetylglucosamine 4-epimerase n=1 Tax=Rhodnius prolixus TaxID=13249 RepID=A0A4P6DAL3_RHOPR
MNDCGKVTVLVTGGGGYVGSHACVQLLEIGYNVVVIDNCRNCHKDDHVPHPESLIRAQIIAGRKLKFYQIDLLNQEELEKPFKEHKINCVLHFAALKSINESCCKPLEYYRNNITGTMNLLEVMEKYNCTIMIYSSSATVYGDPQRLPLTEEEVTGLGCTNPYGKSKHVVEEIIKDLCRYIKEGRGCPITKNIGDQDCQFTERCMLKDLLYRLVKNRTTLPLNESRLIGVCITNPYGQTKYFIEQFLSDICRASNKWRVIALRYFNPVGAHPSGSMGEDPTGIPNNLMPYIAQVAVGKLEKVSVFGGNYDTKDGTGVRDYIHIVDLIEGHIRALEVLLQGKSGFNVYNLGTGKGYSVLEVIKCFSEVAQTQINYEIVGRRPGDIAACYCDASKALNELGWIASRDLIDMCTDQWRWQSRNPVGYKKYEAVLVYFILQTKLMY